MEEVNISTFKATCLALLEKVKQTGQGILILKRGEPIAQIMPPPLPDKPDSWIGCMKDKGSIESNIISPVLSEISVCAVSYLIPPGIRRRCKSDDLSVPKLPGKIDGTIIGNNQVE